MKSSLSASKLNTKYDVVKADFVTYILGPFCIIVDAPNLWVGLLKLTTDEQYAYVAPPHTPSAILKSQSDTDHTEH